MRSLPAIRRMRPVLVGLLVAGTLVFTASAASAGTTPTATGRATPAVSVAAALTATIRLNNCSASLVRFPTSRSSDRAMMLTNGD